MSTGDCADDVLGYDVFIAEPIPLNVPDRVPNGDLRTFPPASITLVHGERDAVLADPPLTIDQAQAAGDRAEASGRRMTMPTSVVKAFNTVLCCRTGSSSLG